MTTIITFWNIWAGSIDGCVLSINPCSLLMENTTISVVESSPLSSYSYSKRITVDWNNAFLHVYSKLQCLKWAKGSIHDFHAFCLRPAHTSQVVATRRGDTSRRQPIVCAVEFLPEKSSRQNSFAAIRLNWFKFVRTIAATKWVKVALSHRVYCTCDMFLRQKANEPMRASNPVLIPPQPTLMLNVYTNQASCRSDVFLNQYTRSDVSPRRFVAA